ncbi:hypothetical protein K8M07_11520 [Schnuerera sp. xch1]|uniref:hypothetical protein n=1 Tax=Schnuerera sp. xch1 TaxID=2874283 RepID=UPI001CC06524|nr:hypothetical protein [Schnuerera sp. xch1]MBZ2175865.1 hypothetical protein [Schnuerera sp. xch1]
MKARDVVLIGILGATITTAKLTLSFIPNVEVVTLLFIIYTITFGYKKGFLVSMVFTTTEIFIYGFSTWFLVYYVIWPMLVIITELMRKRIESEYGYAIVGAIFGYTFGFFFAIMESFFYGTAYGLAYWIRGIPLDLLHGTSNFIIILVLFKPLKNLLSRLKVRYYRA